MSRKYLQTLVRLTPFLSYAVFYYLKYPLSEKNLTVYGATREYYFMLVCLFIIGIILILPSSMIQKNQQPEEDGYLSRYVLISVLVSFLIMLMVVVSVNPHGRFPWDPYPFTTTAAHNQKIKIFERMDYKPQIIVLGSSHAYAVSAEYLSKVTGKSAFNMSVGGAGPIDELALARYVIDKSRPAPLLFLVEMVATDLDTSVWQFSIPLNLIGYLPNKNRMPVLKSVFTDTISMKSLTDSMFLFSNQNIPKIITFLPDGTGVRSGTIDYAKNVKKQIPPVYDRNRCYILDEDGKQAIEELISVARANKISLVFYRSPLNIEFFDHVDLDDPKYKKCQSLLSEYMLSVTELNPNVYYVDLMYYEPVSLLRENGYQDVQHLSLEASNLVIDALLPAIDSGLKWVMGAINSR